MDLTVEVVSARGDTTRLPLSRYGPVRRPLEIQVLRRRGRDKQRFATPNELVLQTYAIPLADFARAADGGRPGFDPSALTAVRFVFDRTVAGTVVIDDVGLSALDPAFLIAGRPPARRLSSENGLPGSK